MQANVTGLFSGRKLILRDTPKPVTPFGGLAPFVEFLQRIHLPRALVEFMPFGVSSPNAIPPAHILSAFWFSVLCGARRFAHSSLLRADKALHALLGIPRFPTDDTIRNFFRKFGQPQVEAFWRPLWKQFLARLPAPAGPLTLDLDSTVFERYGRQEGVKKGHNPRKHNRPSHHPLVACLSERVCVLNAWLRSGDAASANHASEFLSQTMEMVRGTLNVRRLRADSGFFGDPFLTRTEELALEYIVVARLTPRVKSMAHAQTEWRELDDTYAVGEAQLQLTGWARPRRFFLVRERVREDKEALGRRLFDLPGYTYRIFVTNRTETPEVLWRDYNRRACIEQRLDELKGDLAADGFCLKAFFATESAFLAVLFLFNLLSEFQLACGQIVYKTPATLRTEVFLCGAVLGKAGRTPVLHLSLSWGGLKSRKPLFDSILYWPPPTSPKLDPSPPPDEKRIA